MIKKIILYAFSLLLFSCSFNKSKENKYTLQEQLKTPLLIEKDFSIKFLKMGLPYSEFNKINTINLEENGVNSISCGVKSLWSSHIELTNDTLGLQIEFSSEWEENSEKQEEKLTKIILNKSGTKLYNGIEIGKSTQEEIINLLGVPKQKQEYFIKYNRMGKNILHIDFGYPHLLIASLQLGSGSHNHPSIIGFILINNN